MRSIACLRATLTTQRLAMRPPRLEDAAVLARHLADWDVVRWLARVPHPYSVAHAQDWITQVQAGNDQMALVICQDDAPVGAIGLRSPLARPFLGYWLARSHWGQGLMSEAAWALIAHAFARTGVECILSGHFADNAASANVLRKCGFTMTGSRPMHALAQGREVAHIDMVLTRARFEELTR